MSIDATNFAKNTLQTAIKKGYIKQAYFRDVDLGGPNLSGVSFEPHPITFIFGFIFSSCVFTAKSIGTGAEAYGYHSKAHLAERNIDSLLDNGIYKESAYIYKTMSRERVVSTIFFLAMAVGFIALTILIVCPIFKFMPVLNPELQINLLMAGAASLGCGLIGYGINQAIYRFYHEQKVLEASLRLKNHIQSNPSLI